MAFDCAERITTVPELAVNGSILAGTAVYTLISCGLFLGNRSKNPIAQRSPILAAVCTMSLLTGVVVMDVMAMSARHFYCSATFFALSSSLGSAMLGYLMRFAYVSLEYEVAKRLTEKVEFGKGSRQLEKLLRIRAFLKSPVKFAIIFVSLLFVFLLFPIFIVSIRTDSSLTVVQTGCIPMQQVFYYSFLFFILLFIVCSAVLSYFLRRVKENFYIITELKMLIFLAIYVVLFLLIGYFTKPLIRFSSCKFRVFLMIGHMFPMMAENTISIVYPLRKMRDKSRQKTLFSSAGRSSFRGRQQDLIAVLKDPLKSEHFKRFLVKEFASENLLFWMKVENLQQLAEDRTKLTSEIEMIFKEFCREDSVCCINISYDCRETLYKRMKTLDELNLEDLLSVFQESKREIESLMLRDSFLRYGFSKEFKASSAEMNTVVAQVTAAVPSEDQ